MIKITIIIPVYNVSSYIKECINSLINQTLKDIEIVILNDGSTDDSDKIIRSFKDKRIKYIVKENEGIGKTRNKGIELSKGEYITFVDADDYLDITFCEKMYNKAETDKCDIVICDYYNHLGNFYSKVSLKEFSNTDLKITPRLINEINLGPCNKIYKSKILKMEKIFFPEDIKYEDAPFVCKALCKAKRIGKINEALSYFNIHEGSQTTVRNEKIFDIFVVAKLMEDQLKNYIDKDNLELLIVSTIINYLVQSRYIENYKLRNKFINQTYKYLDSTVINWKNNISINKLIFYKRIIIKNKLLLKIYSNILVKLLYKVKNK